MELLSDLQALSGVQFENLCQLLLQKVGFSVETTSVSGDGGIDLIATCDKPFFKGKYIVQCKRYSGSVGVPIVRDLYGVVTAERANKGILITTGHYTASAIEFSADKNLELIAGEQLSSLLHENALFDACNLSLPVSFVQHAVFDKEKYRFYKDMIAKNLCTLEMGEDFIFSFMYKYLELKYEKGVTFKQAYDLINDGFCKEYLALFDWFVNKYYRTGKEQLEILPFYNRKYRGLAQLYNFDLFEYVQARYDILKSKNPLKVWTTVTTNGQVDKYYRRTLALSAVSEAQQAGILANATDAEVVKYSIGYRYYELMNLLSLFTYFKLERGVTLINSILYGEAPAFKEWAERHYDYRQATEKFYILLPTITKTYTRTKSGRRTFDGIQTKYDKVLSVELYFDIYKDKHYARIQNEIQKIEELIRTFD